MHQSKSRAPFIDEFLKPNAESECLTQICRVLHVDEAANKIIIIPVEPRKSAGRVYFVGPNIVELSTVMSELGGMILSILPGTAMSRADAEADDADLDKKYLRKGQAVSYPRQMRKKRWEIIKPLVEKIDERKLLLDPQIRKEKIDARAAELANGHCSLSRTRKMISEIVYQFLAGGSEKGALTPFTSTKGCRGKERVQKNKLGRQNGPTASGERGKEGFVMTDQDKDICGFAWRNYYIRGTTVAKAYRRMCREFYSQREISSDGKVASILWPKENRPTRVQFQTWGLQRSPGHDGWKKQLTKFNLGRLDRVLFGSATDDVVAIGQRGSTDSTSVDMHFVSVENRLDRIGPAHRILVVDSMYGYIAGFYLGLEAPSSMTVPLAFLHALTDKTEWLKWLGLDEIDPNDWIPIRFATVLADNTDARAEEAIEKLAQINTGLKFVGVARSDLNSPSETSHHMLHRMVDHNLHGTTRGQFHERGEERADVLGRHTVIEAIRETARAIHTHNTMELDIVPTLEMRRELIDKGIKLTRANLVRWKIEQGKVAQSLISIEKARIKLLPRIRGTFTQFGVKLHRQDRRDKREFIEPIRYISEHPVILKRVMQAKVARKRVTPESFDDEFLHDPYYPTEIYYRNPIDGELITLSMKTKDEELPFKCSLPDVVELMNRDSLRRFDVLESQDIALSKMEEGQENTKRQAEEEYQEDLSKAEKKPSKSSIRGNKKANREREKEQYQYGMPPQTPMNHENSPPDCDEGGGRDTENVETNDDETVSQQDVNQDGEGSSEVEKNPSQNSVLQDAIRQRQKEVRV